MLGHDLVNPEWGNKLLELFRLSRPKLKVESWETCEYVHKSTGLRRAAILPMQTKGCVTVAKLVLSFAS